MKNFQEKDVICDMMAGIGPFAIPAAKRIGCKVFANDLNPSSFRYLVENAKKNRVDHLVKCANMDGRAFVTHLLDQKIIFSQVIMNLPATAVEFLDVFNGAYGNFDEISNKFQVEKKHYREILPKIHCYGFSTAQDNVEQDILEKAEKHLGGKIDRPQFFNVRNVAPKKEMMLISFDLPAHVAFKNFHENF